MNLLAKPHPGRKPAVVALSVSLALALVACGGSSGGKGSRGSDATSSRTTSTSPSASPTPELPPDPLAPTKPVMFGSLRAPSACAALPIDSLEKDLMPWPGSAQVREEYLDTSVTGIDSVGSLEVECWYQDTGSDTVVRLNLSGRPGHEPSSLLEPREAAAELRAYRAAVQADPAAREDEQLRQALRDMAAGLKASRQHTGELAEGVFTMDRGSNGVALEAVEGPWEISLSHGSPDLQADRVAPELRVIELRGLTQVLAEVRDYLADPAYSQAPTPSWPGGSTRYGATTLVDACALLDRDAFQKIMALPSNEPVEHTAFPAHTIVGQDVSSECRRTYNVDAPGRWPTAARTRYGSSGYAVLGVEVTAFPGPGAARAAWRKFERNSVLPHRTLKTRADIATMVLGSSLRKLGTDWVYFLEGNVVVQVSIDEERNDGLYDPITPITTPMSTYLHAVNTLVPRLQRLHQDLAMQG